MDPLVTKIRNLLAESSQNEEDSVNEDKATEILTAPGSKSLKRAAGAGPSQKALPTHGSDASGKVQKIGDKAEDVTSSLDKDGKTVNEDSDEDGELEDISEEEFEEESEVLDEDDDLSEGRKDDDDDSDDEDEDDEDDDDSDDEAEDSEDDKKDKKKGKFPFNFKKSKDVKEAINIDQHIVALFGDEASLTEEFKNKAKTIFEAAILDMENTLREQIAEEYEEVTVQLVEEHTNKLTEQLDEYLDYIAEEWLEQNALAVEQGIKTEISESFISGLRELFESHAMSVPEEDDSIVEQLSDHVEALEEELNNQINKNIELSSILGDVEKTAVLHQFHEGMSDSQADKFNKLAQDISYANIPELESKLQTIKETYFSNKPNLSKKKDDMTPEEGTPKDEQVLSEDMKVYAEALSKIGKSR